MMNKMIQMISGLKKSEDGATAIEYGLIAALIAVVIIAGVTLVGEDVGNTFNNVAGSLQDASN